MNKNYLYKILNLKLSLLLHVLLILSSCGMHEEKCISMDKLEYVKEFDNSVEIVQIDSITCDTIGLWSIKAIGDLVVLSHPTSWSIWSDDLKKNYGVCLTAGNGPNEFVYVPTSGSCAFKIENDSIISYVCDKNKGKLLRFNVSEFVDKGCLSIKNMFVTDKIKSSTWIAVPIDGESVLVATPNDNFTGFTRNIVTVDSVYEPEVTKALSRGQVQSESTINVLAKNARLTSSGDRCVEAMRYLNQINIFSTDGQWGKTICVGDRLDNITEIETEYETMGRRDKYTTISAWDFGFGAVYSGATFDSPTSCSEIQFFTWDGEPVIKALLPFYITSFDINIDDAILYAIDGTNDVLKAYDASEILEAFNAFR